EKGGSARDHGRGPDNALRRVPRRGSKGARSGARHRRAVAELYRPAALRYAGRSAQGRMERSDEAGGREADEGRNDRDCGPFGFGDGQVGQAGLDGREGTHVLDTSGLPWFIGGVSTFPSPEA